MSKRIKRAVAVFLVVTAVLIMCIPADTSYASIKKGDYEIDNGTLVKYTGKDDIITLPNTIERIGDEAFANNDNLLKVTFPSSVKEIGFSAFENCRNLKKVVFSDNLRSIGRSAFSGCENLMSVNIPKKCTLIEAAAFARCNKLAGIGVDSGNPSYLCFNGVLYSKDGKELVQYLAGRTQTTYSMPNTVEKIDDYAFWGAKMLTNVKLSSKLKEVPEYAFANCQGLTNVVLPYNIESIMAYAFSDCYSLMNITVPDSVGYIDENAFYLTNVNMKYYDSNVAREAVVSTLVNEQSFDEYINSVQTGSYDLYVEGTVGENNKYNDLPYVSSMTEDYSDNVIQNEIASGKIVGGEAVIFMPRNTKVYGYDLNSAEVEDVMAFDELDESYRPSPSKLSIINGVLAGYKLNDSLAVIPDSVNRIGNRVFYKKNNLTGVEFPASLNSIGDFAFARSSLNSVNIPEGTESIGYAAFYCCNDLGNVNIPSSVKTIELGAFEGTKWLDEFNASQNSDFLIVGDGILLKYSGYGGDVVIPEGVKSVAAGSFQGNHDLTSVEFPDGVELIGEDAFNGCNNLTSIKFPNSLTTIEDRAFKDCGLKQVIIPKNVRSIGLGAFDNTSKTADSSSLIETVVFLGNNLPSLSYKNTATRLSAGNLRSMPFEGVKNAVISENSSIALNSILSPTEYGFRGQVYNIVSSPDAKTGELKLLQSDSLPDNETNDIVIDPHVNINGKEYIMTGVEEGAFDYYTSMDSWNEGSFFNTISIEGNTSEGLNNILEAINTGYGGKTQVAQTDVNEVDVFVDSQVSYEAASASASIADADENYTLRVYKNDDALSACAAAFEDYYGSAAGINMTALDISLYDDTTGIPITKLSNKKVDIRMPIPDSIITAQNINVAALDDNGRLEEISSEIVNNGGNDRIQFVASHFSTYIIYSKDSDSMIFSNENSSNYGLLNRNAVVSTLSRPLYGVAIKWVVGVLLMILAMILLIY